MKHGNRAAGQQACRSREALEDLFSSRAVTSGSLKTSIAAIAETQGSSVRATSRYHLATAALLAPGQMQRYAELRGYQNPGPDTPADHKHHH